MSGAPALPPNSNNLSGIKPFQTKKKQMSDPAKIIDPKEVALSSARRDSDGAIQTPLPKSAATPPLISRSRVSKMVQSFATPPSQHTTSSQIKGAGAVQSASHDIKKQYEALPPLLAKEDGTEMHALLTNAGPRAPASLQKAAQESKAWVERRTMFLGQMKEAQLLTPTQESKIHFIRISEGDAAAEKAKVAAMAGNLEDYVFNQPGGVDRFTTSEQTALFQHFYDSGNFNGLDTMMTTSKNGAFTKNPLKCEFHARMALQTDPPQPYYAKGLCKVAIARISKEASEFSDTGFNKFGELHTVEGEALKMQIQSAKKFVAELERHESDPGHVIDAKIKDEYLRNFNLADNTSTSATLKKLIGSMEIQLEKILSNAFFMDLEPIHGTSLAMQQVANGNVDEAKTIFQLTELSSLNRGVYEFPDPANAQSMLIATLAQGKDLTSDQLHTLSIAINQGDKKPGAHYMQDTLTALNTLHAAGLIDDAHLASADTALKNPQQPNKAAQTSIDKMRGMSYNYQGIVSNYIGGNFRFGGLLYASHLNRTDKEVFEKLVETPMGALIDRARPESQTRLQRLEAALGPGWEQKKMTEIEDPLQLMQVLDLFTRQSFHNEELQMEDLHSAGHKIFEKATHGLFSAGGMSEADKRKQVDGAGSPLPGSRTNPSAALSLGLGDCRQHAQTKQMLFDSWRRVKINQAMRGAYTGQTFGDPGKAAAAFQRAEALTQMDLRTFDVIVKAPVKMVQKYEPQMSSSGEHIATDTLSYEEIEDHTMNMLILGDKVHFADSFYQDHEFYHWGSGEVDLHQLEAQGVIYAGDIRAVDSKGTSQDHPIHLVPTPYAGKRDTIQQGSSETFILGIPTEIDILPTLDLQNRANRLQMIQSFAQ